jgi:hypothetical protein
MPTINSLTAQLDAMSERLREREEEADMLVEEARMNAQGREQEREEERTRQEEARRERERRLAEVATLNALADKLSSAASAIVTSAKHEETTPMPSIGAQCERCPTLDERCVRLQRERDDARASSVSPSLSVASLMTLREQVEAGKVREERLAAKVAELEALLDTEREERASERQATAEAGVAAAREAASPGSTPLPAFLETASLIEELTAAKARAARAEAAAAKPCEVCTRRAVDDYDPARHRILRFRANPSDPTPPPSSASASQPSTSTPAAASSSSSSSSSSGSSSGPCKSCTRLKEVFSAKFSEFRSAVKILFGFSLDVQGNGMYRARPVGPDRSSVGELQYQLVSSRPPTFEMQTTDTAREYMDVVGEFVFGDDKDRFDLFHAWLLMEVNGCHEQEEEDGAP